jgi:hypothetical protein
VSALFTKSLFSALIIQTIMPWAYRQTEANHLVDDSAGRWRSAQGIEVNTPHLRQFKTKPCYVFRGILKNIGVDSSPIYIETPFSVLKGAQFLRSVEVSWHSDIALRRRNCDIVNNFVSIREPIIIRNGIYGCIVIDIDIKCLGWRVPDIYDMRVEIHSIKGIGTNDWCYTYFNSHDERSLKTVNILRSDVIGVFERLGGFLRFGPGVISKTGQSESEQRNQEMGQIVRLSYTLSNPLVQRNQPSEERSHWPILFLPLGAIMLSIGIGVLATTTSTAAIIVGVIALMSAVLMVIAPYWLS